MWSPSLIFLTIPYTIVVLQLSTGHRDSHRVIISLLCTVSKG